MRQGFTLVELSIVLVILGLLVGGILVGRDMIQASEYRAQISAVRELTTTMATFRDKYMALPGDMPNATAFWPSATQPERVTNGNGDGQISIHNLPVVAGDINIGWYRTSSAEFGRLFDHLAAADLYNIPQYNESSNAAGTVPCPELRFATSGSVSDILLGLRNPCLVVGYIPGYEHVKTGNKIAIGAWGPIGQMPAGHSAGINPWEAYAIDTKMDDGMPFTGRAVIMNYGYIYRPSQYCATGNTATSPYHYEGNVSIGAGGIPRLRTCALYIDAGM